MPRPPAESPPSLWWASARTGITAMLLGAGASVVVAVLCWLPDAGVSGRPLSAIRAGLLAFLAGHGGGIRLDGVHAYFLPLGLTAAILLVAWRAGRALAVAADQLDEGDPRRLGAALAVQTATYTAGCAVLVPVSRLGTTSVSALPTLIAAFIVFGLGAGAALVAGSDLLAGADRRLVATARAGAGAVAVYLAAGGLLATGSLVLHAGRVMDLSRQVGGGLSGIPVLVLGVLCAPNAALAGTAYLAGPGFAVGSGTTVSLFTTSHGLLPAFPILGALPDGHGANPAALVLLALTVLLAGVVPAWLLRMSQLTTWRELLAGAAGAAGFAGVAMTVLAWRAGGSVGDDRLSAVGASPVRVGSAVAAVVLAVTVLTLTLTWLAGLVLRHVEDPPVPEARDLAKVG